MNAVEPSASSLCARLYHVILEAFRNVISCTKDPQLLSKVQSCGQRFKLWAAGLRIENGDLDAQLDEDADMKDSVLLLLGLILYDLHKSHKHIQPGNSVPTSDNTVDTHGSSLLTARSLQDFGTLNDSVRENSEKPSNLSQTFDLSIAPAALNAGSSDEPYAEDHAHWIASLTYLCPNLQSFVTDSDLEGMKSFEPSGVDSEELVIELVEDIVDTVQQLYDLGPSLSWEATLPKTEKNSDRELQRQIEGEDSMEEGVIHYLRLTQDKFSHISNRLALRLAKANWIRFQRLETARNAAKAEKILLASRKTLGKSHADSGYYTGSKSGTLQGQYDSTRLKDESIILRNIGTEYGSVYSSMDGFGAHGRLRFPAPPITQPKLDDGKVDCTVCGSTVGPFRNEREWRLHVVRDLAPYVCPLLRCESEQIVFDSQRSFITHLRSHQDLPTSWRCQFPQCDTVFSELSSFQHHIQFSHGISERGNTELMRNAWEENTEKVQGETSCPFCNNAMSTSMVQQSKHLGRHLIEVALLSIPYHNPDSDESQEDDTSELSFAILESTNEDSKEINTSGTTQMSTLDPTVDDEACGPSQLIGTYNETPKETKAPIMDLVEDPLTSEPSTSVDGYNHATSSTKWQYDTLLTHRLPQRRLEDYLRVKFGNYQFFVTVPEAGSYRFWIPRKLTSFEKDELLTHPIFEP